MQINSTNIDGVFEIQNKKIEEGLKKTIEWYLENKEWWMHLDQKILDATPWK